MEHKPRLHPRVVGQIAQWGLSDYLFIEVYLALQKMAEDPTSHLIRDDDESPGMLFPVFREDPDSPRFTHAFEFRVYYHADEEHLEIVRASYYRYLKG